MTTEILRVEGLSRHFGGVQALKDVNLTVHAGSIRCVIGPNGAGKSTLFSIISGHQSPDQGRIRFKGTDITGWPSYRVAQAGVVRKFQIPSLYWGLTVYDNLLLAVLGTQRKAAERDRRVREVANLVRLEPFLDQKVANLPHGQTQWLEIGLLLARDAQVLLLDEPTAGMTAAETQATATLLWQLCRELGLSIAIIEHDISFIRDLRSDVTVLHMGSVIAEGPVEAIEKNDLVRRVYLGED